MKQYSGVIASVHKNSIAEEIGLVAGDKILAVNDQNLCDIIDLSFALAEEEVELLVEKESGEQELIAFDKEYDEELGVEFTSAVFDGMRRCGNRCWFCFVDQIAPGMRPSLSVKDDDYRMSFLYGNFVTLTNLREEDFSRIQRLHLSPLCVSVHTTDSKLRAAMLNNLRAGKIMEQLNRLRNMDVYFHTQIVLCPGINDGSVLDKTIEDLAKLRPSTLSLAIVPVGLTRYRENCYQLRKFTVGEAAAVIDQVTKWQKKFRAESGESFVYLGDEFYFLAQRNLPSSDQYDGFPQLENGIGLTRNFIDEWQQMPNIICNGYQEQLYLDIVCGKSAAKVFQQLLADLSINNLKIRIIAVENSFFGEDITVTGLLTGKDILTALQAAGGLRSGVIIPGVALRAGEQVFLDDLSLADLNKELGVPLQVAYNGTQLRSLLVDWFNNQVAAEEPTVYTWQSNAGYSKNKE